MQKKKYWFEVVCNVFIQTEGDNPDHARGRIEGAFKMQFPSLGIVTCRQRNPPNENQQKDMSQAKIVERKKL